MKHFIVLTTAIGITAFGMIASPADPRTIFDDIRDTAPRTIFDDIRDTAPVRASAPCDGVSPGE